MQRGSQPSANCSPAVNLVDQHLHVDRFVRRLTIRGEGVVAGHAILRIETRAAVKLEDVMTCLAVVVVDDQATCGHGAAVRNEIEGCIVGGRVVAYLQTYAVSERAVVGGR